MSSKKLTCGRYYQSLQTGDTVSNVGIFFLNWCPSNLLSGLILPTPPLPCVYKYTIYTNTVGKWGKGVRDSGPEKINTCRKAHLQVNFVRRRHFALSSISLIYLRSEVLQMHNYMHILSFPSSFQYCSEIQVSLFLVHLREHILFSQKTARSLLSVPSQKDGRGREEQRLFYCFNILSYPIDISSLWKEE